MMFGKVCANNDDTIPYLFRIRRSELHSYYDGTGYSMAFIKEPHRIKRRQLKFHTNSRETNALLLYIGNEV